MIDELQEDNIWLTWKLSDWQEQTTAELKHKQCTEEDVRQLKTDNESLQKKV